MGATKKDFDDTVAIRKLACMVAGDSADKQTPPLPRSLLPSSSADIDIRCFAVDQVACIQCQDMSTD
jgi:hypothetical protein